MTVGSIAHSYSRYDRLWMDQLPPLRFLESMHPRLPLQGGDGALGRLQQSERGEQRDRQPDRELEPDRWIIGDGHREQRRHHHVPDHDDDEIRRKIVGALRREILTADVAVIGDLQEAAKQMTASRNSGTSSQNRVRAP